MKNRHHQLCDFKMGYLSRFRDLEKIMYCLSGTDTRAYRRRLDLFSYSDNRPVHKRTYIVPMFDHEFVNRELDLDPVHIDNHSLVCLDPKRWVDAIDIRDCL